MPKVVGIIPCRYQSSRFPGKPLALILGKSLIQTTYENAKRCPLLEEIIVATDDERIFEHVKGFGGRVVMTSECLTGTDRLAQVIKKEALHDVEIVMNVQGDEPCVPPEIISKVVRAIQNDEKAAVATAITVLNTAEEAANPHVVKCVIDREGYALYFSRGLIPAGRSLAFHPGAHYKHLGLYCYRKEFLLHYSELEATPLQLLEDLEQLKIIEHGFRIKTVTVKGESMDVNTPEDIKKVEQLLCKQNTSSSRAGSALA